MTKTTLNITGIHCASCVNIIYNQLVNIPGVKEININPVTEKAFLNFDEKKISIKQINDQINKFGYTLIEDKSKDLMIENFKPKKDQKTIELETQRNKMLFVFPIALLIFLYILTTIVIKLFFHMPNTLIPVKFFNVISMILATVTIFLSGKPFLLGVTRFIKYRIANMDTLIGIGTLTAYIYSVIITLLPGIREFINLPQYTYFDVTIVVIGFVVFGKYLEAKSKMKTGQAIEKLLNLQAKFALVIRNKKEMEIPINEVLIDDIIIVKPGTKIPVDGIITSGYSAIDESIVTGESIPVDKKEGDDVIGGTINKQGSFQFKASKVGKDTMLSQIIKMVEEAQNSRAQIQKISDKISGIFVPLVLILALSTMIIWLTAGTYFLGFSTAFSFSIMSTIGILVIACPCSLGLAIPTAIIVGVGKGAENGILIKNAEAIEKLSSIDTIVFDKTGTITKGTPEVTDIIILDNQSSEEEILKIASSIENLSEHPLAQSIVKKALSKKIDFVKVDHFKALEGVGVKGNFGKNIICVRKPQKKEIHIDSIKKLQKQGKTVVIIEFNEKSIGLIALSDTIKDDAIKTIDLLHKKGIKVIMLTGDNLTSANYIGEQVKVDEVIAEVLPNIKVEKIKNLQIKGKKVAMVGDGINDAPAMLKSDVGIAMATGTDVAIESADIILLKGNILKVNDLINLSRFTMRVIKQNLFWSFIYNIIGIPIAAGALYPIFGIFLNPIFAGVAMAFSSVSVISNSLRLRI